eukprot:1418776-Pyramimonas_sp.AAC.2
MVRTNSVRGKGVMLYAPVTAPRSVGAARGCGRARRGSRSTQTPRTAKSPGSRCVPTMNQLDAGSMGIFP